jgi:hypothetical protein
VLQAVQRLREHVAMATSQEGPRMLTVMLLLCTALACRQARVQSGRWVCLDTHTWQMQDWLWHIAYTCCALPE